MIRDADGLALSSRNAYLSSDERRRALALPAALQLAEAAYIDGETAVEAIRPRMLAQIAATSGVEVEYVAFLRDGTVEEVRQIDGPTTIAIAARVGNTRLIDNHRIG
jgi:pantoate--beta-alanine ligase